MSKEAYYFSHDANARQDEKILMLRADHGWEGYGIYWALIEMMFESGDTELSHNKVKGISVSYNIDITLLESVINTCITEELFVSDGAKFWSETLKRRKNKFHEIKEKKSAAGKKGMEKRWGKPEINNTVITKDNTVTENDNGVITKDNKGKERKVKERKVKEIKPSSRKYEISDMALANHFYSLILENNENAKQPNLETWANDIRLMREKDNRTDDQIKYLMDWSQNDEFWKANILSPSKLRTKFDQLIIKVKTDIEKKNKRVERSDKPLAYSSLEQWAEDEE